jgi:DNA polymerase bacteriophage-type
MIVTLDYETFYDHGYSLKAMTTEEYIRSPLFESIGFGLKINDAPAVWYSGDHEYQRNVLGSLDWSRVALNAHNAMFDAAILNWRFGFRPAKYLDTMAMGRGTVGLSTSCSLDKLGQYFHLPLYKGHEVVEAFGKRRLDFTPEELARYGAYCCNDAEMGYQLLVKLMPYMLPDEVRLIDWTVRAFAEPQLQLNPLVLDEEYRAYKARQGNLLHLCGVADPAELRSDARMALLLESLGMPVPMKTSPKQKNPDGSKKLVHAFARTDIEFMDLLEDDDERVVALVEARLGAKSSIIESRIKRFIDIAQRGTLPMPLAYCGATPTRRWSGTDKINLQNLPRNKIKRDAAKKIIFDAQGKPEIELSPLRKAIVAPPGKLMASADLSQIELRVNAWQSGQHDILQLLRSGGDTYADMATDIYGHPINKKDHPDQRFVGKTAQLGCGYQCGAPKFIHMLKVAAKRESIIVPDTSIAFGEQVVNAFRRKNFKIRDFWYAAGDQLQNICWGTQGQLGPYHIEGHRLWLPNGSFLYYPDLFYGQKQDEEEQGCEWTYQRFEKGRMLRKKLYGGKLVENITQAVARLFVSDALLRLETVKYQDGRRVFDVAGSVHDELIVLFDRHLPEKYVHETLTWAMTTPPPWAVDLPLACEIGVGYNYAECK